MDALRLTYLGWQGWCVESSQTRVLIDPLLVNEVGRGPAGARVNFMFAIPRRFNFGALGPVDAVYLSHEHEDHFNVPTLARLDRRIPIIASGLMSQAGRRLLAEMEFRVDYVWSGDVRTVGDLEIEFFGPNHLTTGDEFSDEWDTTAYLVRQSSGIGVFASNVDIPLGPALRAVLDAERSRGLAPALFSEMMIGTWPGGEPSAQARRGDAHQAFKPASRDARLDSEALRRGEFVTPFPGEVIVLRRGAIEDVEARAPFLETLPGRDSVMPFSNPVPELSDPVVARKNFGVTRKVDLEKELRRFAEHLYGGYLFRLLMSMGNDVKGDRRTFVVVLVADEAGREWVYEYRPQWCDFVQVDKTSEQLGGYLGAVMMWATDFWAVASGEVEPRAVERSVVEARADERLPRLTRLLWHFYHPLRFPERVLAQYRRALALESTATTCVLPRAAAASAR
jgi:hypothetical protein